MAKHAFNKISQGDILGIQLYMLVRQKDASRADVRALLNAGASVTVQNTRGSGLVHHALLAGNSHVLRPLIEAGANYTRPNDKGFTPAMIAVMTGDTQAGRILGGKGAGITKSQALKVLQILYDEQEKLRHSRSGRNMPQNYFIDRATRVLRYLPLYPEPGASRQSPPSP